MSDEIINVNQQSVRCDFVMLVKFKSVFLIRQPWFLVDLFWAFTIAKEHNEIYNYNNPVTITILIRCSLILTHSIVQITIYLTHSSKSQYCWNHSKTIYSLHCHRVMPIKLCSCPHLHNAIRWDIIAYLNRHISKDIFYIPYNNTVLCQ